MFLTIVIIVCAVVGGAAGLIKEILVGKEKYLEELANEPKRKPMIKWKKEKATFIRKNGKIYKIRQK